MLAYANEWALAFIALHSLVIALLSWQVYRRADGWARTLGIGLLAPWFIATIVIATQGWVADMTQVLSPLGFIMTTITLAGLALLMWWRPLRAVLDQLSLAWLMGIQLYRVFGIIFLFGWLAGELPTALGPVTAFNDVFVGLTAPLVAWLWARRDAVRLARAWNIFGLLDFAYAVAVGVLAAPHALRLLALTPDTAALGQLPLSLIVLWAVPLSIFLHVTTLIRLRSHSTTTTSAQSAAPVLA